MSVEAAKAFIQTITSDPQLSALLGEADSIAQLAQAAARRGYRFSASDLQRALSEVYGDLHGDDEQDLRR